MTTDILDTLTEQARHSELTAHDIDDITNRLDDIHDWYPELATHMTATPAHPMDLTGIRGTTTRLPGGDALTMLAPYSTGYTEPDDLPHPAQIISEWADRWRAATRTPTPPHTKWADHLAIIRANVPWFIRMDAAGAFRTDIRTLWHRLAHLTGNTERQEQAHRGPGDCIAVAHEIPGNTRLTLNEAETFAPGIRNHIDVDRHHERTRAKKQHRPPQHRCDPDEKGRYLVADLREHYAFNTRAQSLHSHVEKM